MTSTTIEKAVFIVIGLSIFTIVGVPIYNGVKEIMNDELIEKNFDSLVNQIDFGLNIVENNNTYVFTANVTLFKNVQINVIDGGWALKIEYNDTDLYYQKTLNARAFPIILSCSEEEGMFLLTVKVLNGYLFVQFLKE
ncbi:MAG TPA: hypothetical protein VKM55_20775 [Candidatus Lokiarchaeia archaeon]|nr:hypothetical protein [Candidatus Lokiarchaeia archaeon]